MRLDQFLHRVCILKSRTLAKEACDRGKVTVNGKDIAVSAGTDSIIAGSPTARNLGAIGAGAAAGAALGMAFAVYSRKTGIIPVADITEWYGWEGNRLDRNILRLFDTQYRI